MSPGLTGYLFTVTFVVLSLLREPKSFQSQESWEDPSVFFSSYGKESATNASPETEANGKYVALGKPNRNATKRDGKLRLVIVSS